MSNKLPILHIEAQPIRTLACMFYTDSPRDQYDEGVRGFVRLARRDLIGWETTDDEGVGPRTKPDYFAREYGPTLLELCTHNAKACAPVLAAAYNMRADPTMEKIESCLKAMLNHEKPLRDASAAALKSLGLVYSGGYAIPVRKGESF